MEGHTPVDHTPALQPDPVPLAGLMRSTDHIERHRNVFCGHYMQCLDVSMRNGWASFSCSRCPLRTDGTTGFKTRDFAHSRRTDPMNP